MHNLFNRLAGVGGPEPPGAEVNPVIQIGSPAANAAMQQSEQRHQRLNFKSTPGPMQLGYVDGAHHHAGHASGQQNTFGNADTLYPQGGANAFVLPTGARVAVGKQGFTIDRYLAEGGFAHVFVGRLDSGETAVLKRITCPDADALATVRREIEIMQKVSGHPKIVRYYDSQISQLQDAYEVLILMDYCHGGPVIDLMNRRLHNRLTEVEILHMFSDIVEAVAYLHYSKPPIIHRDLKVENVLLDGSGGYKLCDFGSATTRIIPPQAALTARDIQQLEEEISRQTTLQYRAPEMIDPYQRRGITEKSDIWALGVLLYKLCYYTTPFEETGALAILSAKYTIPSKPTFSEGLLRTINWTLQEDATHRPNIYELFAAVCRLRHVECPLKNIYPERCPTPGGSVRSQQVSQQVQPPSQQRATSVQLQVSRQIPNTATNISPMRRGRPTRHQQDPSSDLVAAFGHSTQVSPSNGFDDAFGGSAVPVNTFDPAGAPGNVSPAGLSCSRRNNLNMVDSLGTDGLSGSKLMGGPSSASFPSVSSVRSSQTAPDNPVAPKSALDTFDFDVVARSLPASGPSEFTQGVSTSIGYSGTSTGFSSLKPGTGLASLSGAQHPTSAQATLEHSGAPLPTMAVLLPTSYSAVTTASQPGAPAGPSTVSVDPFASLGAGLPAATLPTRDRWPTSVASAGTPLGALGSGQSYSLGLPGISQQFGGGPSSSFPASDTGKLDTLESFNRKYPPPDSLYALVSPAGNSSSVGVTAGVPGSTAPTVDGDGVPPATSFTSAGSSNFDGGSKGAVVTAPTQPQRASLSFPGSDCSAIAQKELDLASPGGRYLNSLVKEK